MASAGPRRPSSGSSHPKGPQLVLAHPCAARANSGACSTPRQMFHCRPRVGAVPIGCRRSVRAQVLSCTDCSRARVGVYHRTWAGGTAAPSLLLPADPGPRLDPRSRRAPSPWPGEGGSRSPARQPTAPAPWKLESPAAPPLLTPPSGTSVHRPPLPRPELCPSPLRTDPELQSHAHSSPASSRVGARRTFSPLPWPRAPSPGGRRGPQIPGRGRASGELAAPRPPRNLPYPPQPGSRRPGPRRPPAPYPQPHRLPGSSGRRRAPGLGRRGPLPRVQTWPGLRPLHSARRSALTAPPAAPPPPALPAGPSPGRLGPCCPRGRRPRALPLCPAVRVFPSPRGPFLPLALPALPSRPLRPAPRSPAPLPPLRLPLSPPPRLSVPRSPELSESSRCSGTGPAFPCRLPPWPVHLVCCGVRRRSWGQQETHAKASFVS